MPKSVIPIIIGAAVVWAIGPVAYPFLAPLAGGLASVAVAMALAEDPKNKLGPDAGRLVTVREPVSAWQWIYGQARVGGVITYLEQTGGNRFLHIVVTLAGHAVEDITDVWFDDEVLALDGAGFATGKWYPYVRVVKSKGDEAAATQPFPQLVTESAGKWQSAHRQTGRAKIYVRLEWNQDLFPMGVPNITAVVKGKKVYDPRSALTAWSDNAALCETDYLTNTDIGLGCVYATEINDAQTVAAANTCDEAVTLLAGGTEKRYTLNGAFKVDQAPRDILAKLNTAHGGYARYLSGQWAVYPAVYPTPDATALTEDDLRGALTTRPRLSRRDVANGVKGLYVAAANNWQATDYPPVTNSAYLAEDQNEEIWRDLDLAFTKTASASQRIGKIELERLRRQITLDWPGKLTCYRLQPGDVVPVTLAKYGWSAKTFEVVGATLVVEEAEDGVILGCNLSLRETDANVYAWTTASETRSSAAPTTSLPDAFTVAAPLNVAAQSGTNQLLIAGDGTIISRLLATWDVSLNAFVTSGGKAVVQFKKQSESAWQTFAALEGSATQAYITPVDDAVAYDVRVAFENVLGIRSSWVQIAHTVIGKTAPPADVSGFSINGMKLAWSPVTDSDLWGYRLRFQTGTSRSWGDAVWLHGQGSVQQDVVTTPPFTLPSGIGVGTATLMVKAVDLSGNESTNPAYLTVNLSGATVANVLTTWDRKSAGFPGTKTNGAVDGSGNLAANSTTLMWSANDQAAMWKVDTTSLVWAASAYAQMTYEDRIVTAGARAGSTLTISAAVQGDPWSLQYREPSTKPMWGAETSALMWSADSATLMWDAPAYIAWPGQVAVYPDSMFDILVTTGQGQTQGKITGLTVTLDAPDISETLANVAISSGGTRLAPTKSYAVVKSVLPVVVNDGGTAASAKQEDTQATGPLVKTYDSAGAAVSGHVNARIEGY